MTSIERAIDQLGFQMQGTTLNHRCEWLEDLCQHLSTVKNWTSDHELQQIITHLTRTQDRIDFGTQIGGFTIHIAEPLIHLDPPTVNPLGLVGANLTFVPNQGVLMLHLDSPSLPALPVLPLGTLMSTAEVLMFPWTVVWDIENKQILCLCDDLEWGDEQQTFFNVKRRGFLPGMNEAMSIGVLTEVNGGFAKVSNTPVHNFRLTPAMRINGVIKEPVMELGTMFF